ncbi:bifunctional Proteasome activator PA28 [Babesia duncani]|uniref:Bifunctional Proteasome activator PA28 n=1 Tax=Babesia duncani TaxID=323732 RepID=A0AAD9PIT0_9APIC|nr:bifunctional Proteasome activator PA28 [Babesia duncani]
MICRLSFNVILHNMHVFNFFCLVEHGPLIILLGSLGLCIQKINHVVKMERKLNGISVDKIDPSDADVKSKYLGFREQVTKAALTCLREKIPQKIVHFNSLLTSSVLSGENLFHSADLNQVDYKLDLCVKGTKRTLENVCFHIATGNNVQGPATELYTPHHKQIQAELEIIKCEASQLIEIVSLEMYTWHLIDWIEDGNNFGVGIQEEVIQELTRVEDTAFNLYDAIVKYYMARYAPQAPLHFQGETLYKGMDPYQDNSSGYAK